jgi:hypothetical protein
MLTQLYGDAAHLAAARRHLADYIERDLRALEEAPGRSQVSLPPSAGLTPSGRSGGARKGRS